MKIPKALLFIILLLLNTRLFAQDLLVKNNNDSIKCKIIKQNAETIFYFSYENNVEVTNAIKKTEVKSLIINYYTTGAKQISTRRDTMLNERIARREQQNNLNNRARTPQKNIRQRRKIESIKGHRINANYGAAYWLFLNPDGYNSSFDDYFRELKTGNCYSFGYNYYGKGNFGLGLQYMNFMTKNAIDNVLVRYPNGSTQTGRMSNDVTMQYIGISFGLRYPLKNNKWRVLMDIGMGYSGYKNKLELITKSTITANTLGVNSQIGFDYLFSKKGSIGITGTLIRASSNTFYVNDGTSTKKYTLPDGEEDSYLRGDISIGLRFLIE